jgi:hypothetical protein
MQICCYNNVKYFARIYISLLPFGDHLVGNFFSYYFFQQWEIFLQILLYLIDESVLTNNVFF